MRSNNLGQVGRGITRAGSKIEDMAADGHTRFLPASLRDRTPDPMLQSEPGQFFLMRAKDVIAF
jgi:hypothetical protein